MNLLSSSISTWIADIKNRSEVSLSDLDSSYVLLSDEASATLTGATEIYFRLQGSARLELLYSGVTSPTLVFGGDTRAVLEGLPVGEVELWSLQLNESVHNSLMDLILVNSSIEVPWQIEGEKTSRIRVVETQVSRVLAGGSAVIELVSPLSNPELTSQENGTAMVKWAAQISVLGVDRTPLTGAQISVASSVVLTPSNGSLTFLLTERSVRGSGSIGYHRYPISVPHLGATMRENITPVDDEVLLFDFDSDRDGLLLGAEQMHGTSPQLSDSDGDQLLDGAEVNLHGSNPLDPDTDGDGLNDNEELAIGADPLLVDPDGDLWPDPVDISPKNLLVPNGEIIGSVFVIAVFIVYAVNRRSQGHGL